MKDNNHLLRRIENVKEILGTTMKGLLVILAFMLFGIGLFYLATEYAQILGTFIILSFCYFIGLWFKVVFEE
jgi:hypothetical protein